MADPFSAILDDMVCPVVQSSTLFVPCYPELKDFLVRLVAAVFNHIHHQSVAADAAIPSTRTLKRKNVLS